MTSSDAFAAELLEASATGYAALATERLLAANPDIARRFSPDAPGAWRAALGQRIVELATALRLGEPKLFAARVTWARRAFEAREVPDEDLRASLLALGTVLAEELPEATRTAPAALLNEALAEFDRPVAAGDSFIDPQTKAGRIALAYIAAVLEGDSRKAAELVLARVASGLDTEAAYLDVLVPAQREVGRLWHAGELGVIEEHIVTNTTERLMALLAHDAERAPANGRTVVCAAVTGNVHDIAVRVLADFFEIAGWRAVHLGGNVPTAELGAALQYFDGELLVLSAALSVQLPKVAEAIAAVRRIEDRRVRVMVGGLAFSDAPEIWRRLGADGYAADARAAVKLAAELCAG
ncbi:MAG TPA: cobalamin-dependent protein [Gammaproteobacteria bacterium]|nr:cobalamin-dependent protein [Gammaproteobacteria bacterium]